MREQVGPPKSARHDSSLFPLHSNISSHKELMHFVIDAELPFLKAGQPPKGQQGSAGVQLGCRLK
jgi:hypothetical protein